MGEIWVSFRALPKGHSCFQGRCTANEGVCVRFTSPMEMVFCFRD